MKIKAVVVDELPAGCGYCPYERWSGLEECAWCAMTNKHMVWHNMPRPDWCPLMKPDYDKLIMLWKDDVLGRKEQ